MPARICGLLLVVTLALQGCLHYRHGWFPAEARRERSAELLSYFDYPKQTPDPTIEILEATPQYVLSRIEFPFLLPPEMQEKPLEVLRKEVAELQAARDLKRARDRELLYTVRIDFYESREPGKRPLLLVTPILGGVLIVDIFARFFARRGYSAAIVHQIRTRYDAGKGLDQVEWHLRVAVIRIRQALDWLATRPDVDLEKIGSFGISYGGVINTLLAAVEPRTRCHVIAMAGGPIADIIVTSKEKPLMKYVREAVQKRGYTVESLREGLREKIRSDTLVLARYIDSENVLFFIAGLDRVVKRRYAEALWQALGKPEVIYIPLGHYSSLLALPYVENQALQFYRRKFGTPSLE